MLTEYVDGKDSFVVHSRLTNSGGIMHDYVPTNLPPNKIDAWTAAPYCLAPDPVIRALWNVGMPSRPFSLGEIFSTESPQYLRGRISHYGTIPNTSVDPFRRNYPSIQDLLRVGKTLLSDWNFEDYQYPKAPVSTKGREEHTMIHFNYKGSVRRGTGVEVSPLSIDDDGRINYPVGYNNYSILNFQYSAGVLQGVHGSGASQYKPSYDLNTHLNYVRKKYVIDGDTLQGGSGTTRLTDLDWSLIDGVLTVRYEGYSEFAISGRPRFYRMHLSSVIRCEHVPRSLWGDGSTLLPFPSVTKWFYIHDMIRRTVTTTTTTWWEHKEKTSGTVGPSSWSPTTSDVGATGTFVKTLPAYDAPNNFGISAHSLRYSVDGFYAARKTMWHTPHLPTTIEPHRAFDQMHPKYQYDLKALCSIAGNKALENSIGGLKSNHLETLSELDSLRQFISPLAFAALFYRHVRSGRWSAAGISLLDLLANAKLVYSFGLAPSYDSAVEFVNGFDTLLPRLRLLLEEEFTGYGDVSFNPSGEDFHPHTGVRVTARCKLVGKFSETTLVACIIGLRLVGLLPNAESLWELVSWSFFLDWFTNTGNKIEAFEGQFWLLLLTDVYSVYSLDIEVPLPQEVMDLCDLRDAQDAKAVLYLRGVEQSLPSYIPSRIDLLPPTGIPDWGLAAGLAWTSRPKS